MPFRQIVSFVNFPPYILSKFLCRILSGLLRNEFSVHNSKEFVDHINDCSVNSNELLVSLDDVGLFTSVPEDKALDLVLELLCSDEPISSRTSFDISDIKHGLELCHYSPVFFYNISLCKQTFGTPTSSCIFLVIANIFTEHIERKAIITFHSPPSLWLR